MTGSMFTKLFSKDHNFSGSQKCLEVFAILKTACVSTPRTRPTFRSSRKKVLWEPFPIV